MTAKEALEKLNYTICLNISNLKWNIDTDNETDCVAIDEFCYCYDVIDNNLIDFTKLKARLMPMKPIKKLTEVYGYCPKCNSPVSHLVIYCYHCGQALDWSDEK